MNCLKEPKPIKTHIVRHLLALFFATFFRSLPVLRTSTVVSPPWAKILPSDIKGADTSAGSASRLPVFDLRIGTPTDAKRTLAADRDQRHSLRNGISRLDSGTNPSPTTPLSVDALKSCAESSSSVDNSSGTTATTKVLRACGWASTEITRQRGQLRRHHGACEQVTWLKESHLILEISV